MAQLERLGERKLARARLGYLPQAVIRHVVPLSNAISD
jgi:hypothetical protein